MKPRQIVGIVLGVAGVVISIGHLVWMMLFKTREPYHGFGTWVMLGIGLVVVGIFLSRTKKP
ncbi:MAG: hypothetical protein ABI596_06905 [Pyrinomonadaceae bacterium]